MALFGGAGAAVESDGGSADLFCGKPDRRAAACGDAGTAGVAADSGDAPIGAICAGSTRSDPGFVLVADAATSVGTAGDAGDVIAQVMVVAAFATCEAAGGKSSVSLALLSAAAVDTVASASSETEVFCAAAAVWSGWGGMRRSVLAADAWLAEPAIALSRNIWVIGMPAASPAVGGESSAMPPGATIACAVGLVATSDDALAWSLCLVTAKPARSNARSMPANGAFPIVWN